MQPALFSQSMSIYPIIAYDSLSHPANGRCRQCIHKTAAAIEGSGPIADCGYSAFWLPVICPDQGVVVWCDCNSCIGDREFATRGIKGSVQGWWWQFVTTNMEIWIFFYWHDILIFTRPSLEQKRSSVPEGSQADAVLPSVLHTKFFADDSHFHWFAL